MKTKATIALVMGDGSAPEMMEQATRIVSQAALLDNIDINWVLTPMGWNAYREFGDTTPASSMEKALEIGLIFFGGVGDPAMDTTIGREHPEMIPEARALLQIRQRLGLLLNFRPMILMRQLSHLSRLKAEYIPAEGVKMVFLRFLLEDSYFGTQDLLPNLSIESRELGFKLKKDVIGDEDLVAEIAYYRGETVRQYFRAAFEYARSEGLPLISVDKANVMARYAYWRKIATEIGREYPDVKLTHQLVDSANMLLFHPEKLHGVIACGNEHGDILSDGAAEMVGGIGLMHSSAINPVTRQAMFESGAGTAPTLAGRNMANPLGRILTGAMLLKHIGSNRAARAIEDAVGRVLAAGLRTADIAEHDCEHDCTQVVSCSEMGEVVSGQLYR